MYTNDDELAKIKNWLLSKEKLETVKNIIEEERFNRKLLCEDLIENLDEGTSIISVNQLNCELKLTIKYNRKINIDLFSDDAFKKRLLEEGIYIEDIISDNVIDYKPVLNTHEYKCLSERQLSIFNKLLITTKVISKIEVIYNNKDQINLV